MVFVKKGHFQLKQLWVLPDSFVMIKNELVNQRYDSVWNFYFLTH